MRNTRTVRTNGIERTDIFTGPRDEDTMGGRLSRAREAAGLSVKQLAARLGVRVATVNAWEGDRSQPGAHRISKLAGLTGVSLSWLLHGIGTAPVELDRDEDAADAALAADLSGRLDRLVALHSETGALIERLQTDLARLDSGR